MRDGIDSSGSTPGEGKMESNGDIKINPQPYHAVKYVAGLDGGGTKTNVVVADEQGKVLNAFTSGALNLNGEDHERVRQNLREILSSISKLCGGMDYCVHICIGAAGISHPEARARLTNAIRESGYHAGLTLVGDHEAALYGALENPHGMILIAGTGSICYGVNERGISHRTGGFGHLIDDEGSGYSIGREILSAVVKAHDRRIPPTLLEGMVTRQLRIPEDSDPLRGLVGFVYDKNRNKRDIAALAPLLNEACALGDGAAIGIAHSSAESLSDLVVPVAERLSLQEGRLAFAGSVLLHNTYVQSALRERLARRYPRLDMDLPRHDAAWGAAMMALSLK
ncbi:BadF/BadG/BcrA/BcrD ATPase family protein [Paenibacillus vini]|uniref:BadF/BadG/BcrA/BcrD ATPase family protein n=1 Tax=Paenibacillus vini TaxID=1476024 RepID=UPI00338F8E5E